MSGPAGSERAPEPVTPSVGLGVLHLFYRLGDGWRGETVVESVRAAAERGTQVVAVAILGHKADLGFMALDADLWNLRLLQRDLAATGLEAVASYVSLTEVSEYAAGVPEELKQHRLYPQLPPPGKPAWCFYPMSKRRGEQHNWFTLPFEERRELMHEHGSSGRNFSGRVLQVVTGSTGIDDFEWGVTLFAARPDDLKDVVYTLRYDRASAIYAEFGPFYVGMVTPLEDLVSLLAAPGPDGPS
ncbi:MAG: chlorite dismutase [Acidimicrobiia bacterium]|nr:chlorite dismutase [Acidimicrobiia bacterium]MYC45187.1 chlorite dismutase [Acidimicrobiia bacterium]MYI19888.1 chlorite dismutase [Acidimicrobiia bacterium]